MGIFDKLRAWLTGNQPLDSPPQKEHQPLDSPPQKEQPRYDRVQIINVVDGTTIEGHDAVKAHFEKEQELFDKHGMSIMFQVFRVNLAATSISELEGRQLVELKVPSGFASGTDTVRTVKNKLRPLIDEASHSHPNAETRRGLTLREADQITFSFSNHRMLDEKLFYADHFMVLPVWVQVFLHDCDYEYIVSIAHNLHRAAGGSA